VVARVRDVAQSRLLKGRKQLVVDATGVGIAVVDLLRSVPLGCDLWPVVITGGHTVAVNGGYWSVPKRDLVIGLQVLMESGTLTIASGMRETATLTRELAEMRVRVSPSGQEQFGVWREGEHDDLVLAVALACWAGKGARVGERQERLL
jgi:hypothetical protein